MQSRNQSSTQKVKREPFMRGGGGSRSQSIRMDAMDFKQKRGENVGSGHNPRRYRRRSSFEQDGKAVSVYIRSVGKIL